MKAILIKGYGGTDTIIISETEKPIVQKGKLLVEVKAASLNRIDSAIRNGYMQKMLPLNFPAVQGGDFAGLVVEIGEGVTNFKKGDIVYGNAGAFKGGSGSLAEVTLAVASNVAKKPDSLSFTDAASLPLVGTSALQGIEDEINIKSGQKILIQGGAGGIGSIAIQIAKLRGAHVAATVATDDVDFVKSLGADEVIDYKISDVTVVLKDFDAVFDTAGGEGTNNLFSVLNKGGILVTMAGQPDQELAKKLGVTAKSQMTAVSTEQLTRLAHYVDSGKVKVQIEKVFSFEQSKEAYEYFETKHPRGKIVVEL